MKLTIEQRQDLENRLDWLDTRIGFSSTDRGYVSFQMIEFLNEVTTNKVGSKITTKILDKISDKVDKLVNETCKIGRQKEKDSIFLYTKSGSNGYK